MERGSVSVLSLPVVAALLAILTLALLFLGRYYGLGSTAFYLLVIPIALAIAYLAWYRTLPYEPARPHPRPVVTDDAEEPGGEPFEDPVEEADRLRRDDEEEMDDERPAPSSGDEPEVDSELDGTS